MKKDPMVLLEDILDCIQAIRTYTLDMSYDAFLEDGKTQDAVVRRFEVMGEAVRKLPQDFQDSHPQMPWRKIVGMRNVLAHEYDDIALEVLWDTIVNQLGSLESAIKTIIAIEG